MRAVVLTAGLLAVMGLVTGCSSKCEAVCGNANACDISERAVDVDCPEFCADVEDFNVRAKAADHESCDAQFQAHLDCWDKNSSNICNAEYEGCVESGQAWVDCMKPYCEAVAADKATDPNCSKGVPTLSPF
ncbi:hypothetical protein [Hyalangium versicolor]|uniref:hypothetical protein n=1 Tax=Hyalangium versicolor TaxID=2861190 RepID=UPI001CCAC44B|nr:hypothetical protein [Hyalangium versicolor]